MLLYVFFYIQFSCGKFVRVLEMNFALGEKKRYFIKIASWLLLKFPKETYLLKYYYIKIAENRNGFTVKIFNGINTGKKIYDSK